MKITVCPECNAKSIEGLSRNQALFSIVCWLMGTVVSLGMAALWFAEQHPWLGSLNAIIAVCSLEAYVLSRLFYERIKETPAAKQ